ncbi:uncharacterized protein tnxba [Cololabis saira]|uniref:uncharacterized protein tnxba n=1 Tax=Cololabis saira TaxID=129043 RepID=UPI002AD475BF|nr:uncharacterized protein tnxba [Cololabis saira]
MMFTLGLLLLLTPFPSCQTTTNERRDATRSELTKAHAVFTLSKPKTTAALSKQTIHPTLKPNTVNQTVLPTPASNQKPQTVNATAATKSRPNPSVIQTTPSAPPRAPVASGTITNKGKHVVSDNQTSTTKSPSVREVKTTKDKPAPTGAPNIQITSIKPPSVNAAKTTKEKVQPSFNHTVSVKSPTSDGKTAKDKPAQKASTTIKSGPTSGTKNTKNTSAASVNQNVVSNTTRTSYLKSKDKPALTKVHTVLSTPAKTATTGRSGTEKDKVAASANHTSLIKTPSIPSKEKPAPSQPIKVVISKDCDSSSTKEQELKLKPGAPLVMTHKISLLPGGCAGGCEAEMVALKGRVARLEKEMTLIKEKCPCSSTCLNECSGNGKCDKGKCLCQQGFTGPDCSKCMQGAECNKKASQGKSKVTVATITLAVNKDKENMQQKITKVEHTLLQRKGTETKESDLKPKVVPKAKAEVTKPQGKQETSDKKKTVKVFSGLTKNSHPTVGQVLLKYDRRKGEEARKGKTTVLQKTDPKLVKDGTAVKTYPKSDHLKDEPQSNATQSMKKINSTAKSMIILSKATGANKTITGKEILDQSTITEKNVTQSYRHKQIKIIKEDSKNQQSSDNRKINAGKTGKDKTVQKIEHVTNATILVTSDKTKIFPNITTAHGSEMSTRRMGGLGLVKAANISSYTFTVTWAAPKGMFKNFTVIRREPRTEDDQDEHEHEGFEEEPLERYKTSSGRNATEVYSESTNTTAGTRGKAETKRISVVVPGSVRSVEFSNLRTNTRYVLYVYGTAVDKRSKIHRITAITGPEPPSEMVFSNVTESSLVVSWTKPKVIFTGFRVAYFNIASGESRVVTVTSKQSQLVLSELSAGSSYIISVSTTHGRAQSDELTSVITTVPAPPAHLQVVNVTDTRAVLQWTPSLGKVDRFIISYESSKTPNVTVTVMLSGNAVEHQLRGLQRGTLYTVKVLSQKDSLQSMAITTTFTTANVVKASEVGARSALIAWRSPVVYHSYRVIYGVAGEETKEVILESTVTEYKLTRLLPMSRYNVVVQGEKNEHYTSVFASEFITGKLRFPFPTECSQELLNGALHSGEVDIYPEGREGRAVRVYCDMETDGGGWTVFQRRMNGKTDFYKTWSEYRAGFGNLSEEFWLGNELLHNLTSVGAVSLRVDMQSGNDTVYAHYGNFSIASEDRNYALAVSGYTGTAGDSMRYHNGRPFSTRDKDPASLGIHCAKAYMGGWWYKNCYKTNLNGLYGTNIDNQGVVWIDWKGKDSSIPFTEMKFRPSRFSPATHG